MVSIGFVVSNYRKQLTDRMLEYAKQKAIELNARIVSIIRVPGAFECPLAVKKLLEKKEIDGVVVLAVVLQGKTWHDIIVAENSARKIADLSIEFEKPVCSGMIGPRVTKKQAEKRLKRYSEHAVKAVIEMAKIKA